MKIRVILLLITLTGFGLLISCKKDLTEAPRSDFKADLLINKLICYPNDSTSLSFELSPKEGNGLYSYKWILPDTFTGSGPFVVNLVEDLKISVTIKDSNLKQLDFSSIILKDTIDSLKYDYRNDFIGDYICDIDNSWPQVVNSNWEILHKRERDTITVYKSQLFSNIIVFNELKYYKENKFGRNDGSEWTNVSFTEDSVYYYYSRLARYWSKIKGKKLKR